ncbi:MAG: methyltransferase domain-containing protein [Acidimicrobiales bacterium]|nr:methyltransferase domain-containing protein [Acidimicrobiales bacterium]NNF08833.1 methyltransferase domain-containing protein [Acidimicrobiia bacterium]
MTTTTRSTTLDERIVESATGALEMFSIHLGRTLGLYDALIEPRTVAALAAHSGIAERYAREWLEQQAVAGLVGVDAGDEPWDRRRYSLSPEQRAVLVDADDPSHVSPLADMLAGVGHALPEVAAAYRSGGGVPYSHYGKAFRDGQGGINRPALINELASEWLADVPETVARLRDGGRVADLGCGTGWSTIALAKAFPRSEIVGFDLDDASIEDARTNAAALGVNVRFESADAAAIGHHGRFDLVLIVETLHDLAAPIDALRAARTALNPGGVVLIADEKVAAGFIAPGDELERMMYGWSVTHCLPASKAEADSAAIGTVLRPGLLELMAAEAGFRSVSLSDVDGGFFNLYILQS